MMGESIWNRERRREACAFVTRAPSHPRARYQRQYGLPLERAGDWGALTVALANAIAKYNASSAATSLALITLAGGDKVVLDLCPRRRSPSFASTES